MRVQTKLISSTHPTLNLSHPTIEPFVWNTLIRGAYVQSKGPHSNESPLRIFLRMRFHRVEPDFYTFPFLLQSFNSPSHLQSGQRVHAQILHFGLGSDPFVQTSLINMYSSSGNLGYAQQVFDEISQPDLPSWNSIVNANVKVGTADVARELFDRMPVRNVISWSCMLNGYVTSGDYKEALSLFRRMQTSEVDDVRPNAFTMSVVLSACGRLGALEHGKWAHAYIDRCGMEVDVILGTSLIDMYAKCGSIDRARWVFNNLGPNKDVMAWSAMISGLAIHGHGKECLKLFSEMKNSEVRPNAITLLGVLCACVHGGLVNEGKEYFTGMNREFGIVPSIQHYGCMVDLYGRTGLIKEAWDVVHSMPMEPDVLVWGALLSGSRMHGDIGTCEVALNKLIELEPTNSGAYVLLSNVYAKVGKWKDARNMRDLMEVNGVRKVPGWSLIEVDGFIHEFFVGDESHPETKEIYLMLEEILDRLNMKGYADDTKEVPLDLDEEGKEMTSRHIHTHTTEDNFEPAPHRHSLFPSDSEVKGYALLRRPSAAVAVISGDSRVSHSRSGFELLKMAKSIYGVSGTCESYLIFRGETALGDGLRTFLYVVVLAYCFLGLSAITARFFLSMENVVKQTRAVVEIDPQTNAETVRHVKVWNYTIADIALLAFGTSFPQISLATIDAIQNIGNLYAGGLGPGTLVGSAAFDLFPIHAVCVVVPKAGELKKISDVGVWLVELFWSFWAYVWLYIILEVWTPKVVTLLEACLTVLQFGLLLIHAYAQDKRWPYLSLPLARTERPEDWVPAEATPCKQDNKSYNEYSEIFQAGEEDSRNIVNIFSIHSRNGAGHVYQNLPCIDAAESSGRHVHNEFVFEEDHVISIWKQQFMDALMLEDTESRKLNNKYMRVARIFWQLLLAPWRFLFAFVPPYQIAHGWIAFILCLTFISGIAYIVTKVTDLISCVTGINAYVIAFTALASGTSWPDLVASKIAAERQTTADSAIANITCSNSVNIYVGIGIPWLIDTAYNFIAYREPLRIQNSTGLSFSLLVFFATSVGCIAVLVFRRLTLGAELGGPRLWAWLTSVYLMLLWIIFVVVSSLKVSGII